MQTRLVALFPLPHKDVGIGHICLSVCGGMHDESLPVTLVTPINRGRTKHEVLQSVFPPQLPYRAIKGWIDARTRKRFLAEVGDGGVAYLWSDVENSFVHELKERGVTIVREKFNCGKAMARRLGLEEEHRLGWESEWSISEQAVRDEADLFEYIDYVFTPSPMVKHSLEELHLPASKILETSFGWSPSRFPNAGFEAKPAPERLSVLFVGEFGVRKGAPLLLDAWNKAGIRGDLLIAGHVVPQVETRLRSQLHRPDIELLGFTNTAEQYLRADIFVMPSLEEGGPLVTYEAMAHGVPVLVSPMGAGAIVRHGQDGLVVDPHDTEAWATALRRLAEDRDLRMALGEAGYQRAQDFTWSRVAERRRLALLQRLRGES